MIDASERKLADRKMADHLIEQYKTIVPGEFAPQPETPWIFTRPTLFQDDRPAITRTCTGV